MAPMPTRIQTPPRCRLLRRRAWTPTRGTVPPTRTGRRLRRTLPRSSPCPPTVPAAVPVDSPDAVDSTRSSRKRDRKGHRRSEHHPGRVAAVVVLVLVALLGLFGVGFFAWQYINKQDAEISQLRQQVSDLQSKEQGASQSSSSNSGSNGSSSTQQSSGSSTVSNSGSATQDYSAHSNYVGTWTGDLKSTSGYFSSYRCWGASQHPISIEFKNIASSGQATVDCKVLYHGHKITNFSNDAQSSDGDNFLDTGDLTTTFDPQTGFSFNFTPDGDNTKLEVEAEPDTSASDNITRFDVTVKSIFGQNEEMVDTYTITKTA